MQKIKRDQQFDDIVEITWRKIEQHTELSNEDFRGRLLGKRDLWFKIGFWRRDHFAKLCSWEAMLGPDFLETYAGGQVHAAVNASNVAHEAISAIEKILNK